MQSYTSDQLRNVVLIGHGGSGKTTLAEAMLFASGALSRMGSIEAHNTVSDYDELEHAHSYSISASLIAVEWSGHRINVIDAPGYADFEGEVVEGCAAADAALITVDAASGVQAGTDSAWQRADEAGLPRMVVVSRLDRENTDFEAVLAALRERFGTKVVPLAVPDASGAGFSAVTDLLTEAPESAADAREMLVESVAETDDDLLNKYLEGEEIGADELSAALASAVAAGDVVPVLPASATGEIGVKELMDRVVALLPSPLGREHALEEGSVTTEPAGAVVAHVFKTTADPFVGRLTYMKVLRGTLKADQNPYNVQRKSTERLAHLFLHRGKEQIEVPELVAGDIGVAAKLADTLTGDTLVATEADAVTVPPLLLPVPTYRSALHPRTKADVDKLSQALQRIMEQDPTIQMHRDADTHEMVLLTLGDAQVKIAITRLEKTYGVVVDAELPRVPYRETITTPAKSEYKHKKQTGGHGQYGHVVIEISPLARGDGVEFEHKVVGGNVPRQFIPAVEKGVNETLPDGPLANSPIVDVKVTLLDGSAHSVDSSEMAFKIATAQALKQGILDARPVLLEPVMKLSIRIPSDYVGDVMGDLNTRRGHVHGVEPDGMFSRVEAEAPLAEVQRYSTDLRAITQGHGSFTLEFDRYVEVPGNVQERVLKQLATASAEE
ncbi:MAG: elongation factor G [Dehalococcoidia bacterium]